jgi:hypothetical protein
MTAVVARPTTDEIDDPKVTHADIGWEGRVATANMEHVDVPGDVFSPEYLGRVLVQSYWDLGADIRKWWMHYVEVYPDSEDGLVTDSGTADWVYIGAARFLVMLRKETDGWSAAFSLWSDDPADAEFQKVGV